LLLVDEAFEHGVLDRRAKAFKPLEEAGAPAVVGDIIRHDDKHRCVSSPTT
jgi:hypothetical protein